MQTNTIAPPPVVQVGGKQYHVDYGLGSLYLLSTWGINVQQLASAINVRFETDHYTDTMFQIAAAGLGRRDSDGNWESLGLTPLQLADRLKDGEQAPLMKLAWKVFTEKNGLVPIKAETAPADQTVSTKTPGSDSGPSEQVPVDSA